MEEEEEELVVVTREEAGELLDIAPSYAKVTQRLKSLITPTLWSLRVTSSLSLVPFMVEYVMKETQDKLLLTKIESLFLEESSRKYLLRMRDEESTEKLAELLAPGVTWPG